MFTVFIGSSSEARPYAEAVSELIDEHPLFRVAPWWRVAKPGESFFSSLFDVMHRCCFGVFVATPDDLVISRGRKTVGVRDNVLFEYGLFAGHLGNRSAILLRVGDTTLPSDLMGVTDVRAPHIDRSLPPKLIKESLRDAAEEAIDQMLAAGRDDINAGLHEVRDGWARIPLQDRNRVLSAVMERRLERMFVRLPEKTLSDLVRKYRHGEAVVGREGHRTRERNYIDLQSIEQSDLRQLGTAYTSFAASYLRGADGGEYITRVALHYKRDPLRAYEHDLKLLAEVTFRLGVRPAMIDLDAEPERRVKGRCLDGERAILMHDFTSSGFTPVLCISALKDRKIEVSKIVSFLAREEHLDKINSMCAENRVTFHVMCVETRSGDIEIQPASAS